MAEIAAPAKVVWRAIVDAEVRQRWWSHLELDPVPGGSFTERWTGPAGDDMVIRGSVVQVSDGRRLRLTWSDVGWPASTEVEIDLSPGPAGTTVQVRHSGFGRRPDGHRLAEEHRAGWQMHLANLRSVAEG